MGDDLDLEAYAGRFAAAVEAGEIPVPPVLEGEQGCWFALAATEDPAAVVPEGFAEGGPLDGMEPSAVLAAMAETACGEPGVLGGLSDEALLGLVGAGRRLAARGAAVQQRAVAEYARRQREADRKKAGRAGFRLFAQDDLAPELMINANQAQDRMTRAEDAERRLPRCSRLLWDGRIGEYPMKIITDYTMALTDEGAAEADEIIASAAPGLTPGQLRAMAARVAMSIDPEACKERRKEAAKKARVERFQEIAGTAALCGRDLPTQAVLRSWAHIDSRARALRAAGAAGTLEQLRVAVYLALTSGHDPLVLLAEVTENTSDHVTGPPAPSDPDRDGWPWDQPDETETETGIDDEDWTGDDGEDEDGPDGEDEAGNDGEDGPSGGTRRDPGGPASPAGGAGLGGQDAPVEAVINLLVPAGTLFGWSATPGEIPGYGPVDPDDLQDLVQTAAAHPKTRWCVTVIDPGSKEAVAHGCAPGQHRWTPNLYRTGGGDRDGPDQPRDREAGPGSAPDQQAAREFLASLRVELAPIAVGQQHCDHRECTDKYVVPRTLKHLVRARKATCVAPCCGRPADGGDADHTIPWPQGPTCQENLGGLCRYHHRCKQATGWLLEQPEPGTFAWRGPSGRTRTTKPGRYLI
jgi:hypothetical protein